MVTYSTETTKVRFLVDIDGFKAGEKYVLLASKASVYTGAGQATTTLEAIDKSKVNVVVSDDVKEVIVLTQAAYDALPTKDANADYRIVG